MGFSTAAVCCDQEQMSLLTYQPQGIGFACKGRSLFSFFILRAQVEVIELCNLYLLSKRRARNKAASAWIDGFWAAHGVLFRSFACEPKFGSIIDRCCSISARQLKQWESRLFVCLVVEKAIHFDWWQALENNSLMQRLEQTVSALFIFSSSFSSFGPLDISN